MAKPLLRSLFRRAVVVLALVSAAIAHGSTYSLDYRTGDSGLKRAKAGASGEGVLREARIPSGRAPALPGALSVGDTLGFSLFDGVTVTLTLTDKMASLSGADTFLAQIDGMDGMKTAVVMQSAEGLQVDIQDCASGLLYKVASTVDGVTVREIRPTVNDCDDCETLYPPNVDPTGPPASESPKTVSRVKASSSSVYVDVLVAYDSPAAAQTKSNSGNITNFAEFAVQKMNLALANTGLGAYFNFRLVGVFVAAGDAGDDIGNYGSDILRAITDDASTFNGYNWSVLKEERDKVNADVVSLLINSPQYGTTGRGYSLRDEDVSEFADWAYNICSLAAVEEGHTMTHEVGHNMGAGHAAEMASGFGPQLYTYSSGYYFTAAGTAYHTIMAYSADGYGNYYTGVPYFSSPNHTFKGVAVGNSTHDNTRTIRNTYLAVSNFRSSPIAVPSAVASAIGAPNYKWETSEAYPWWNDGGYAASYSSSGTYTSWIGTRVKGPATLTFQYNLRTYYGTFKVLCDGTEIYGDHDVVDSGSDYWAEASIPSGTHEVRLVYSSNGGSWTTGRNGVEVWRLSFAGGTPVNMATVTFDATGGSVIPVTKSVTTGSAVGTLPVPFRNLYTFDGWYTTASGGTKVSASTTVSGNVTYYAHWTKLPYSFSGDADWTLQPDGSWRSGVIMDDCTSTISRTLTGPGTLTFKWKVSSEQGYDKLYFRVNGSEVSAIPAISGETSWATVTYKVSSASSVKVEWSYERDSMYYSGQDCGWIKDITWAANYTVQYHKYDGSGATRNQAFSLDKEQRLLWMDSQLGWSRANYEFVGWVPWNPDTKPRLCKYVNGQSVKNLAKSGETVHLWAAWKSSSSYRVCFNRNDGSGEKMNQVILRNKEDTLAWMDSQIGWTRSGYKFQGWAESANGAVKYANGAKVKNLAMNGGTKNLYAVWSGEPYTVQYHKYDGSGATRDQTFKSGVAQNLLWMDSQLGWSRANYEFVGWVPWNPDTKPRLCKYVNGQSVKNLAKSGETVHLWAAWKSSSSYRVCFNRNDGSGEKMNQVILRNKEDTLAWMDSQIGWTRSGYKFQGWAESANGAVKYANGAKVKNLAMNGGTKNLYAVWRAANASVKLSDVGHGLDGDDVCASDATAFGEQSASAAGLVVEGEIADGDGVFRLVVGEDGAALVLLSDGESWSETACEVAVGYGSLVVTVGGEEVYIVCLAGDVPRLRDLN